MIVAEMLPDLKDPLEREKKFTDLYEDVFPVVAGFVSKQGGSLQDAKDIFQDALVIFYEKTVNKELNVKLSDEAYIIGIAKHLWIRKFKTDYRLMSLDALEKEISIPENYLEDQTTNKLLTLLQVTGRRCLELLRSIYYEKQSMEDISKTFGFSGPHSASVQKYKCIEKMKDKVKEKSLSYEDFQE
jgi:DNA-directed RNA polymerase specialized sigma24 family protein